MNDYDRHLLFDTAEYLAGLILKGVLYALGGALMAWPKMAVIAVYSPS